jgi:hypothetical protein
MRRERIKYFDPKRIKMTPVQSDQYQFARPSDRRDRDSAKPRIAPVRLGRIAQYARDPCGSKIEDQDPIGIVVEDAIEPPAQIIGTPVRAAAAQFGDTGLEFGGTDRR